MLLCGSFTGCLQCTASGENGSDCLLVVSFHYTCTCTPTHIALHLVQWEDSTCMHACVCVGTGAKHHHARYIPNYREYRVLQAIHIYINNLYPWKCIAVHSMHPLASDIMVCCNYYIIYYNIIYVACGVMCKQKG